MHTIEELTGILPKKQKELTYIYTKNKNGQPGGWNIKSGGVSMY
jgi:hypothetical protein